MSLRNWLNGSYPLIQKSSSKLLLVLSFSLFTWIFLLIYQPFGATEIEENRSVFLLGFGLMAGIGLAVNYFLFPLWFKSLFDEEKWQVKKEILFISSSLILISILNYLYNSIVGLDFAPQHSLLEFIGITMSVGIFPIIVMVFLVERFLSRKNKSEALELNRHLELPREPAEVMIHIHPDSLKAKPFLLSMGQFLFANSSNNYVTIYYLKDGVLKKELIRLSMKKLEEQLLDNKELIRCHRSYLVNKTKVREFQGNARSLHLLLEGSEQLIPVARSMAREWLG